jgi:lysyl-tRNA synthetase class II
MMKKIVRILNIRRHKTVSFLDVYENFSTHLQLLCSNELLTNLSLSAGDIISFEGIKTVNHRGIPIIEIKEFYWHNPAIEWNSPKGIYNPLKSSLSEIRYNSRNSGKQLQLFQGKIQVLKLIKELLTSNQFLEVNCKIIEEKRTSAKRQPLVVTSIHEDTPLYLRITMENQLKQYCATLLHSVFSIDNVFYDKAITANADREVCILELVSIEHSIDQLIDLIVQIDTVLRSTFSELNLQNFGYSLPTTIEITEYDNLADTNIDYSTFQNAIIKHVPVTSPFVRMSDSGFRTEFQWIVRGKMLAHGYEDEFDYANLLKAVNNQKNELHLDNCNQMDYMKYAIPRTTSLGLGFDQLLFRFWNLEHIINISNPIGIYFD